MTSETLASRDKVLVNEWLPVLFSADLQDKPVSVQLLDEKVVIFRTKDGVHAFKDLCIHRGLPLSMGRIVNDRLECAYHGWTYDSCGQCVHIPAQPPDKAIPKKAKAIVYSCKEQYGIIWVCLGEPAHPMITYEPYDAPAHKSVFCGPYKVEAAGPRIIENFLDVSHLMFIHEGYLGDRDHAEISDFKVKKIGNRLVSDEIAVYQANADGRGKPAVYYYTYEVRGPLTALFTKRDPSNNSKFTILLVVQPETENKSVAYMIVSRDYDLHLEDEIFISFQDKIFSQDLPIVEAQHPELLPLDLQEEMHLKSDKMSIEYRRWLNEINLSFGTA